jgi:hypothetical protein
MILDLVDVVLKGGATHRARGKHLLYFVLGLE